MKLITKYMTRNDCYTAGRKITPKGIMVHSTATPGVMAADWFRRWNKSYKAGEIKRQVCVHAFLDDKEVWQYLPWDHRGWHAGGDANNTHIGFEICEPGGFSYSGSTMVGYDAAKYEDYFRKCWENAVALCVLLCKMYGLTEKDIICHSEGYHMGIASNHVDVMHWFPRHGESMDSFRSAVKKVLTESTAPLPSPAPTDALYRIRKSWDDAKSQKGAFKVLDNAKRCANANPGHSVFDSTGKLVYGSTSDAAYEIYRVVKGDSLWKIAAVKLGNGTRYPEIKALNGLTSDTIHPGQKLKFPR